MSNEERCDCCQRYWYIDDLVSGLCPNCLDFLATKNQMDIEQGEKIKELKQQLAEKDKESLKYFKEYRAWKEKCELLEQDQNQTAIAELNNILDTFAIFVNEEKESMVSPDGNGNLSLLEYIENRIDTLKGEK